MTRRNPFATDEPTVLKCPSCKKQAFLEDCDQAGADEGNVFCPLCGEEFNRWSGKPRDQKQGNLFRSEV